MSYSQLCRRLRLPLGFVFGIGYFVLARPSVPTLIVGGVIALLGVLVRAWAAGHISKNQKLATSGPYAYTRNPLYFGSFLIALGFGFAAHWVFIVLAILFFALVYYPTMQREIANIREWFPDCYPAFQANVPLFLPRFTPWRGDSSSVKSFDPQLYLRHKEWKAALTYVIAMLWLAYRAYAG